MDYQQRDVLRIRPVIAIGRRDLVGPIQVMVLDFHRSRSGNCAIVTRPDKPRPAGFVYNAVTVSDNQPCHATQPRRDRPLFSRRYRAGDLTANIIPEQIQASATVVTREGMVLCGTAWFDAVFERLNLQVAIEWQCGDGDWLAAEAVLCRLSGPARALLTGERTALNLLQTLSATASVAREYANAVAGTGCKVLDTRKTLPGLRLAQKYAVQCGGCFNHRIGLFDAVLIKENHILAAGSIADAVRAARSLANVPVEVEVENLEEFEQALAAKPDR